MCSNIIGENIKKIRNSQGMNQSQLAKSAGIGISTLSEIESGLRKSIKTTTLTKLAKALNVNVDKLTTPANEITYEVTDLKESLKFILTSDEVSIDNIKLSSSEKEKFMSNVNLLIELIRKDRKEK